MIIDFFYNIITSFLTSIYNSIFDLQKVPVAPRVYSQARNFFIDCLGEDSVSLLVGFAFALIIFKVSTKFAIWVVDVITP